ncbi:MULTISPECIES: serine hydrolase domain-containing protein [Streptomyces]|uniref:Serine hydrolase domain-containing protein n=1 Tax=Streptomyces lienomycini TaxID=284035 RepID=A0ABV9X6S5_9ACTN|nr:serine hydrolase domain-containing protein [Streptomyces sp. NBC_00334]
MSQHRAAKSRFRRRSVTAVTAVAVLGGAVALWLPSASAGQPAAARPNAEVRRSLDGLVRDNGFPAALASVRDEKGHTRNYTAGVGDREKKRSRVPVDGQIRIASTTKLYTATVVLQLVGEGRIGLDTTVETYLPGLVRGDGIDGRNITVRQLLQHTSGLPNYTRTMPEFSKVQHTFVDDYDLLDLAFKEKASFPPGKGWEYSNTNYTLAGLIVQKVTGRPIGEEITTRIIERLGLRHTYWPGEGEQTIRERHPHGYTYERPGAPLTDATELDPSWAGAAGQLVARPSDVNRVLTALMDGKLLKPAQLEEMRTTVETKGLIDGWRYGLGLMEMPLSCGGVAWGHGGDFDGYENRNGITDQGRSATVAVTALPSDLEGVKAVNKALDTALCTR